YRVLATGAPLGGGRFQARAVRDIGLAVGRFHVQTAMEHGVRVRVASPGVAPGMLDLARKALRKLSARYGPYPWRNYTVVVPPDLRNVGIEYPTLSFIGASRYPRLFVDHETAHQWFYSLVGNDQARDPWLDETLAAWAQVRLGAAGPPPPSSVPPPPTRGGAPGWCGARHGRSAAGRGAVVLREPPRRLVLLRRVRRGRPRADLAGRRRRGRLRPPRLRRAPRVLDRAARRPARRAEPRHLRRRAPPACLGDPPVRWRCRRESRESHCAPTPAIQSIADASGPGVSS